MAEYQMTINELEEYVDLCIQEYKKKLNKVDWEVYKVALMAALTMKNIHGEAELDTARNVTTLWNNKIEKNSEFLFGKKYIKIRDIMIPAIRSLLITGFLDGVILSLSAGSLAIPAIAALSNASFELYNVFKNASELDDLSLCIYLEACNHKKKHKKFTMDELKSWYAQRASSCFHTKGKWVCCHDKNGNCSITERNLETALKSLCGKGFMILDHKASKEYYKFKM